MTKPNINTESADKPKRTKRKLAKVVVEEVVPEIDTPPVQLPEELPTFREVQDAYRKRNRMGRILHQSTTAFQPPPGKEKTFADDLKHIGHTYVRERVPGEVRGKSARRAAKREKVKAMKAAQGKI